MFAKISPFYYTSYTISLAEIDTEDIKRKIQESPYKNIKIQELRTFIEEKLEKLLQENKTRISFSERYKAIIDKYNSGNSSNENYYEDLIDYVDDLKEEEQVKLSAKKLYEAIMREDSETKVVDWYKDEQPRRKVKLRVEKVLDDFLPESYSRDIFTRKSEVVFTHLLEDAMMGSQRYAS